MFAPKVAELEYTDESLQRIVATGVIAGSEEMLWRPVGKAKKKRRKVLASERASSMSLLDALSRGPELLRAA